MGCCDQVVAGCLQKTFLTARLYSPNRSLICHLVSVTAELFVRFVVLDNIYCDQGGTRNVMPYIFHALERRPGKS